MFSKRINQCFLANDIDDDAQKRAILLNMFSEKTYILIRNLCVPNLPGSIYIQGVEKHFERLFYTCKIRVRGKIENFFYNAKKNPEENIQQWAARVRSLASTCSFTVVMLDTVLRDVFVIGVDNSAIMDKLFEEDTTKVEVNFAKVIKIAEAKESTTRKHSNRIKADIAYESTEVHHNRLKNYPQHQKRYQKQLKPSEGQSNRRDDGGSSSGRKGSQGSTSSGEKCGFCVRVRDVSLQKL